MKERHMMGKIGDLHVTADRSAAGGFLLLWAVFSLLGRGLYHLRPRAAITGGLLATGLHFLSELWHQMGHARAAEHTGFPMTGIHLWGMLGTSIYPPDEPELPDELHIERALGGPRASAGLALAAMLVAFIVRPVGRTALMVASLFALDNLFIFSAGALLPLPFLETDGAIIQRYRQAYRKRMVVIQE
ncbi:MAG: hypothetical protein KC410_12990 [Anaerolineales bacterium]|nr:hypothetical protein [Anaerolineales bacterium]MCB8934669.1 hypothetical protein [Promineifilum sp.]